MRICVMLRAEEVDKNAVEAIIPPRNAVLRYEYFLIRGPTKNPKGKKHIVISSRELEE